MLNTRSPRLWRLHRNQKTIGAAALFLAVVLTGWLESRLAITLLPFHTILLSSGLALGGLVLSRRRLWPWITAAMVIQAWWLTEHLMGALITAFGLTSALLVAAELLLRSQFNSSMPRVRDVLRFLIFGCGVPAVISATFVSLGLQIAGLFPVSFYSDAWWHWIQSYVLGVMIGAPLLLVWSRRLPRRLRLSAAVEWSALLLVLTLMLLIVSEQAPEMVFLPFPFMIWAAFRLGMHGVTAASLPMIFLSFFFFGSDSYFFGGIDGFPNLDVAFVLGSVLVATGLLVGAANHEREQISRQWMEERNFAMQVMQALGQGVTVTNVARQFEFVNNAFAQMLGYRPNELLGKAPFDITAESDHKALVTALALREELQTSSYETTLLHKNGRRLSVLVTGAPRLQNGKVVGSIAVVTDLTQHKKAELQLRQRERQYRQLLTAAQRQTRELKFINQIEAAVAHQLDLSVIFPTLVNTVADTLGFDLVALYMREGDVLHMQHQVAPSPLPDTLPTDVGVIGQVLANGEPVYITDLADNSTYLPPSSGALSSEICIPLRQGSAVVGVLNVECGPDNPLSPSDFNLMQILGERLELVLERAQLYKELQQSEERLQMLIKHSGSSVTLANAAGQRVFVGPAHSLLWGQSPDSLIGESVFSVLHAEDVDRAKARFMEVLQQPGRSHTETFRVRRGDGGWLWAETTVTNLLHEPSVQAMVLNTRDITERVEAEEAVRQAQKLESLGVLAGGVAHDFNNLLAALMGQISVSQAKLPTDSAVSSHLEKALKAAERAASLTQQLLAYSGRGQFVVQLMDLNQVILENMHLFRVAMPKSVDLVTALAEDLPLVEADIAQMQQLVMNLIINGAEAIGEEGGVVRVETAVSQIDKVQWQQWPPGGHRPDPGTYVTLTISDTGCGMDAETITRIFDPFYTTKFTGRGLGLSAVLGIIRGHGGGLRVESAPGAGSQFRVLLPLSAQVESKAGVPSPVGKTFAWRGAVLVVDDEDAVREMLVDMLAANKLTVLTAVDGASGIERFRQYQDSITLIILDLSMPGMSSEAAFIQLKQIRADVPILISSGYTAEDVGAKFMAMGAAGFLQKPYTMQALQEKLAAVSLDANNA